MKQSRLDFYGGEITIKYKERYIYRFFKRIFDILASGLFLLLFGWLILIFIFIKFCEDGHNPIYTSKRVGKDGKIIKFHKIRSMIPDADKLKDKLIAEGKNEADGPAFKMKDDPRITKFGKFLRKTSLDELPQIWDIFVGRMSVTGPRPPIPRDDCHNFITTEKKALLQGNFTNIYRINFIFS